MTAFLEFLSWWWEDSPGTLLFMAAIVAGLAWLVVHYFLPDAGTQGRRNLLLFPLAIVAVIALIAGLAWLVMVVQEWLAGNPIDLGRKVLGTPGYVFWAVSMLSIVIWNSQNKR